jgi:hypothetical protein
VTINRWIAGILLFDFKLVHVPAIHHTAADGLSQQTPAPEDPPETNDFEEWIDDSYRFFMELASWRPCHLFPSTLTMHLQFTQVTHTATSASASLFITEETTDDTADASADASAIIPRNLRASAADACLSEVKEYLESLTHLQNLTNANFRKFMQYSSGFFSSNGKLW